MAISKEVEVNNQATTLNYWKYSGFNRMARNMIITHCPVDANGQRIPQAGVVVLMDGYSTADARNAAKTNGRYPDFTHEFLITNWEDRVQVLRECTLAEKQAYPVIAAQIASAIAAGVPLSDDQINAIPLQCQDSVTVTPHNDYTTFMAALNTPNEAATAYALLKQNPVSAPFFANSTDC